MGIYVVDCFTVHLDISNKGEEKTTIEYHILRVSAVKNIFYVHLPGSSFMHLEFLRLASSTDIYIRALYVVQRYFLAVEPSACPMANPTRKTHKFKVEYWITAETV